MSGIVSYSFHFVDGTGTEPSMTNYCGGTHTTIHLIFKLHALHSLSGLNATVLANGATDLAEFAPRQFESGKLLLPHSHL